MPATLKNLANLKVVRTRGETDSSAETDSLDPEPASGAQADAIFVAVSRRAAAEDRLDAFVEEFGLAMDRSGLPRAAGRMFAWLLVCDPPEQSAAELGEALHSSTGGVSQNLRLLQQLKFIERVGKPRDRRAYYRVAPGAWLTIMAGQQEDTTRFRELGQRGLAMLAEAEPARRARLAEMTDFYAFLEREIPDLIERYRST
jgi:DNA-binding transcriptional regulator GbsR (MarR family)